MRSSINLMEAYHLQRAREEAERLRAAAQEIYDVLRPTLDVLEIPDNYRKFGMMLIQNIDTEASKEMSMELVDKVRITCRIFNAMRVNAIAILVTLLDPSQDCLVILPKMQELQKQLYNQLAQLKESAAGNANTANIFEMSPVRRP